MTYTGFLRGINVGGHHKVPMAELRRKLTEIGCEDVRTVLNSGNIIFETDQANIRDLESKIESHISQFFHFEIPVILQEKSDIADLVSNNPFENVNTHKDVRLYVSFLKDEPGIEVTLPYTSKDDSYKIISVSNRIICSVLDLSITKTPKGMDELEKLFGKNITTRNWNTILKINDVVMSGN